MPRDLLMGAGLRLLQRLSTSELLDRLGLRKQAETLVREGAKAGFQAAAVAARRFKPLVDLAQPERLPARADKPQLFDLTLTDEQQMIRDSIRQFADEVMRPAAEKADETCTLPEGFVGRFDELGVRLLSIPEKLGGAGGERSPVQNALVTEDLARGDMGLAFAALAPLGVVHALVDHGTAEQQAKYLAAFAEEAAPAAAIAVLEPVPLFDPYRLETQAVWTPDGYQLTGTKSLVPLAATAQLFLVAAHVEGAGPRLFLVERGAPGVSLEPEPSMGLRAAGLGRLSLSAVRVGADAVLGGKEVPFDYDAFVARGRIAWAEMAVGTAQAVVEYVIPYVNERVAFGEPISNRQAVAFMVADLAIELEGMRLLAWRAASRAEHGRDYLREAALARIQCVEKAMKIGTDGVQLLGGHGYVKDHPVERWYRDLRAIAVMDGGLLV